MHDKIHVGGSGLLESRRFEVDIGEVWCVRWYDAEKPIRILALRTNCTYTDESSIAAAMQEPRSSNERSGATMLTSPKYSRK